MEKTESPSPGAAMQRLPKYFAYLKIKQKQGVDTISSTRIAEDLRLNPVLVRKDLALACHAGRPKTGYPLDVLIADLESYLGYSNTRDAFLVGAGRLGQALMAYEPFTEYGLTILAAFDVADELVGTEIVGKPVLPVRKLETLVRRMQVQIAILTVPATSAQSVCDLLCASGIRAIWNFTPASIETPGDVIVQNENLATSFAVLSGRLTAAFQGESMQGGK